MRTGPITWVGGEHDFALRLGELRKLQESCNAGPEQVLMRLRDGTWRVDDVIEPIRLGLIGGGMETKEAGPFVTTLMDQHPILAFKITALEIMFRAIAIQDDDRPGKDAGVETPAPENGDSPGSTETAP